MSVTLARADVRSMYWPAAALAGLVLGFAIFYGSIVQSRLEGFLREHEDADETTG
jgi:hypothetical protein